MHCRNCGKAVDEKAAICVSCGVPPNNEKKFCGNCGVKTEENQAICVKCGVSLSTINFWKNLWLTIYKKSLIYKVKVFLQK